MDTQNQEKIVAALSSVHLTKSSFVEGIRKYVPGARVPLFGHAKHSAFSCRSTEFVNVPDTYSSSIVMGKIKFHLEVAFATNHDQSISLRMFDPGNPSIQPTWAFELKGGHAPNSWWNFHVTESVLTFGDPWPRQSTLQIKSVSGSEAFLGSVIMVIDEII